MLTDVWKMQLKSGASSDEHSFSIRLEIWSGPGALWLLILFSSVATPSCLMQKSGLGECWESLGKTVPPSAALSTHLLSHRHKEPDDRTVSYRFTQ